MKYFVVSDIHSYYNQLIEALTKKGFDFNNASHKLIICGDAFDRGSQTIELFEFMKSLGERFIYIRGNHEDLLESCVNEIKNGEIPSPHHFRNGTVKTICQFCKQNEWIVFEPSWKNEICKTMEQVLNFINKKSVNYHKLKDYVFVHGWIPYIKDHSIFEENNFKEYEDLWKAARWVNGMAEWKKGLMIDGKTIICGHYHCSWGWSHIRQSRKEFPQKNQEGWEESFEPFVDKGIIAIDSCVAYSNLINCFVIEE